ncbi:hypothetical protein Scep_027371 [Stephania cephalantha]|uniref:Uncharacterized protein n=1 Tax=Stephania cephalantha TaxID=152367 RepID=A0AAP0HIG0_9MAGN
MWERARHGSGGESRAAMKKKMLEEKSWENALTLKVSRQPILDEEKKSLPAISARVSKNHKGYDEDLVTEEAAGEQWFAVGSDDDRWWSEVTAKGVGRPQTATASRRQWRRDWWTQQWRVGDSGGGDGGTGGTMRCEAAVRGSGARRWTQPQFARWKAATMAMDSATAVR